MTDSRPDATPGPSDGAERSLAEEVLRAEAEAVRGIVLGPDFHRAVDLFVEAAGRERSVVVSGLGKSGLVGQKISATLASTGTPSHFLHPVEAMHGDLGRVRRGDAVLLLSFGGNTEEVVALAALLAQDAIPVIAVTGSPACELGRRAAITLPIGPLEEACPHNLAPTASTTAMLALGDALALCASRRLGFGVDQFHRYHPGGSLGRLLKPILEVARFRVGENLPLASPETPVAEACAAAGQRQRGPRLAGALLVVDAGGRLAGIFTDADLRRLLVRRGPEGWHAPLHEVMTAEPRRLEAGALVRDAVRMVRAHRIDEIPVVDAEDRPTALIDVQDLMALKVIEE